MDGTRSDGGEMVWLFKERQDKDEKTRGHTFLARVIFLGIFFLGELEYHDMVTVFFVVVILISATYLQRRTLQHRRDASPQDVSARCLHQMMRPVVTEDGVLRGREAERLHPGVLARPRAFLPSKAAATKTITTL